PRRWRRWSRSDSYGTRSPDGSPPSSTTQHSTADRRVTSGRRWTWFPPKGSSGTPDVSPNKRPHSRWPGACPPATAPPPRCEGDRIEGGYNGMCRLFGMSAAPRRVRATFWLLDAADSLAVQSRREPDGVGLGVFDADGTPRVH